MKRNSPKLLGLGKAHIAALRMLAKCATNAVDGRTMRPLCRRGLATKAKDGFYAITAAGRAALK